MVQHKGGKSKAGSGPRGISAVWETSKVFAERVEKKMVNVHMRASGTIYIFCSEDTHYKLDLPG